MKINKNCTFLRHKAIKYIKSKSKYPELIWIIYRDSCYSEGLAIEALRLWEAEAGGEESNKGNDKLHGELTTEQKV